MPSGRKPDAWSARMNLTAWREIEARCGIPADLSARWNETFKKFFG